MMMILINKEGQYSSDVVNERVVPPIDLRGCVFGVMFHFHWQALPRLACPLARQFAEKIETEHAIAVR